MRSLTSGPGATAGWTAPWRLMAVSGAPATDREEGWASHGEAVPACGFLQGCRGDC